ncbi:MULTISPECIES: hypothetical protein [unclassified Halorubrum]|uniref:hypothetical protein n=1 Tax=unclassified Halorubrum TaxID=2642239 RepID=UPI0018E9A1BD|nr:MULTISPECIES: hypothetical protein [unclassified Halorubrum]
MTQNPDMEAGDDRAPNDFSKHPSDDQRSRGGDSASGGAEIVRTLRSMPTLWLPFLVAGCVLTVIGRFRIRDPLPVEPPVSGSTLQIVYTVYPTGTTATSRSLDALINLPLDVLLYAVGLELLAIGAIATAGGITMVRASDRMVSRRRFLVYTGGISVVYLITHLGTAIDLDVSVNSLLVALGAFAVLAFVAVRLFLLPVAVLFAEPLRSAPVESWRRSRGHGVPLFALIVGIGLTSGWLVAIPYVGVVLSVMTVGTVHAVALTTLYELYS